MLRRRTDALDREADRAGDRNCSLNYCWCSWRCFRFTCVCRLTTLRRIFCCCRKPRALRDLEQMQSAYELPGKFPDMLQKGQLFAALILATTFSDKYQGRNMWADAPRNVVFKDEDGNIIGFEVKDGRLLKTVNGQRLCGDNDSTGVITQLTWSQGNRIVDQHGRCEICPDFVLGSLRSMADLVDVQHHNLPALEDIYANLQLSRECASTAEVKLPGNLGNWNQTLLGRYGCEEASCFIWLGDASVGDRTLYVAFGPLRQGRQALKVCCRGSNLEMEQWGGESEELWISSYMKTKLDLLWDRRCYDFFTKLHDFALEKLNVTDRILFCGISHGAALAQAAALKFACLESNWDVRSRVHVVSWNAYKWTDAAGSALASKEFKAETPDSRCLPLILSKELECCGCRRRRYDSVPEHPAGYDPMPRSVLLDVDTGKFFRNVFLGEVNFGLDFCVRAMDVHFGREAIKGIKRAMQADSFEVPDAS